MSRRTILAYLGCAVIWGTTWHAIRVCIADDGYAPLPALLIRFALSAILLWPIARRYAPWPRGRNTAVLVASGVLNAIGYGLVYRGEQSIPGGAAAVVYGTQPLVLAMMLVVLRVERITARHIVGALISLAGVVILFIDRMSASAEQAAGVAMVFASVIVATIYTIMMKQVGNAAHSVVSTAIFLAATAFAFGVFALFAWEPIIVPAAWQPTAALLYLAILGSVVAFFLYFWLLERTSLQLVSSLVFVYPLIALVTDLVFEHSVRIGLRAYLGAALTLAGLAVKLTRQPSPA